MKKIIALALACLMAVSVFSACSRDSGGKKIIQYSLPEPVESLDPQFAYSEYARMIISNIYEGLFTRDENGALAPGIAESYELSADKLVYTFSLRGDAVWQSGAPVTADDFVFAFRRMFRYSSPSGFARDYIVIKNAREILAGITPVERLGVTALKAHTLEIRLEHPCPEFPELLADTPAMPCEKSFFEEARGRYGLIKSLVNANGPFYVERWDNETVIYLRPNTGYVSPSAVLCGGINLYIGVEPAVQQLMSGSADIGKATLEDAEKLRKQGLAATEFESTVWCIVFNQNSPVWGNPLLRQGLALTIEPSLLSENIPPQLSPASLFIPSCMTLAGEKYRPLVSVTPMAFDPAQGRRLFEMGLGSLGADALPGSTFYVPDSAEHLLAMGMVQQSWQKHLSAYVNMQPASTENIQERFRNGDYGMLLLPFSPAEPRAENMLAMFSSGSDYNRSGYKSALFDNLLNAVTSAPDLTAAADYCARAESLLLHDAVIIPVYTETAAFVSAPGITGITPTPFTMRLYFKYAEKR